jgi:hypothetical protein
MTIKVHKTEVQKKLKVNSDAQPNFQERVGSKKRARKFLMNPYEWSKKETYQN